MQGFSLICTLDSPLPFNSSNGIIPVSEKPRKRRECLCMMSLHWANCSSILPVKAMIPEDILQWLPTLAEGHPIFWLL